MGEVPGQFAPKAVAGDVHSWIGCSPMNQRRVDAHQHFWRPSRGDYAWLRPDVPALAPLYRDVLPPDLLPALRRHGVQQTVLVQAAATEAETDFLLGLADATDHVGGVVGWV